MGFSVSGSTAVIFAGIFIALVMVASSFQATSSEVSSAWEVSQSNTVEQKNTEMEVTEVTYNQTSNEVFVNVTNNGSATLSKDKLDLLVNGSLDSTRTVDLYIDGVWDSSTDIWVPRVKGTVTAGGIPTKPSGVKVVVDHGVSDINESDIQTTTWSGP